MIPAKAGAVGRQLEVLWTSGTFTGLSDAQLLGRFTGGGDGAADPAFRELVNRHGSMVLGVCRQILRHHQDADDAFQATFLVLVRKARSIRVGDSLAPWLYGVAYRTAHRARVTAARYRTSDIEPMAEAAAPPPNTSFELDFRPLLHEELSRLPGKYREPIVLCHLEGKSHEEAAKLLSWPVGTLSGRLSRGRQLLRSRLERRGVAAPSAMLAARWLTGTQPGLSPSLVDPILRAATRFAVRGTISTPVQSLTQGVLRTMLLDKLKAISLAVVVVSVSYEGAAAVWASQSSRASLPSAREARGQVDRLAGATISEIRFEGNATIPPEKIKAKLLSKVGQPFDNRKIDADVKTLFKTHWFSQVNAYHHESPARSGQYALIFAVREMPVLTYVEFRGRKAIRLKDLEDTTGLKKGSRADPTRTRNAVHSIYRLYKEKGYDLAEVELIEGGNAGDTKVVMQIFEGPKVKIGSINFVGCQFATPAMLRTQIAAQRPINDFSGKHHRDLLDECRQKLIEYYQGQGFFEARVTPVTRPAKDPGEIDLTFVVHEGIRYSVRKVIIQGNSKLTTEKLMDDLELHSGKPYLQAVRDADKNRMLTRYSAIGCIDTEISVEPRFTGQPGVVDLLYNINEAEPHLLDRLDIEGNDRTREAVIRREAVQAELLPGEILDENRLEIFRRRLMMLGYFRKDPPTVAPARPSSPAPPTIHPLNRTR